MGHGIEPPGLQPRHADADATEDDLVPRQRHRAVQEGPFDGRGVERAHGADRHLRDRPGIEDLHREVIREGEWERRIRQPEGRVADHVQAGGQRERGRVLIVRREPVGGVDRTEAREGDRTHDGRGGHRGPLRCLRT